MILYIPRPWDDQDKVPLLPRHGIRLHSPCGDGRRFARRFVETWARIPLWARRAMLAHWRKPPEDFRSSAIPSIQLLDSWPGQVGKGLRATNGCSAARGHVLLFSRPIVEAYPDDIVRDLVAHELAHVVQEAVGQQFGELEHEAIEWEEDADDRMAFWGFDPESMDRWAIEKGIVKPITPERFATFSDRHKRRIFAKARVSGRGITPEVVAIAARMAKRGGEA